MTESELNELLQKNPNLKVKQQAGKKKSVEQKEKSKEKNVNTTEKKKRNKYWNVKTYEYEDGFYSENKNELGHGKLIYVFDSKKEFNRWIELNLMVKEKKISNLDRQKMLIIQESFMYEGKKISAINYKADFIYEMNGKTFVEDVKGYDEKKEKYRTTKDFNIKWKLLKKIYPQYKFVLY